MNGISVVIPAYNSEINIKRCVDSLLCQSVLADEIIIVNDGSSDHTGEICNIIASKSINVKVVHTENYGPVAARQKGVSEAKYDYIAFADADDWVEEDYIEILKSTAGDVDLLACAAYEDYPDISIKIENYIEEGMYESDCDIRNIRHSLLGSGYPFRFGILPFLWNKLYKKDVLMDVLSDVDINIYDGEDVVINCAYIMRCSRVVISNKPIYHYVWRDNSLSREKKENFYDNVSRIYRNLYDVFSLSKDHSDLIKQLDDYMRFMVWTGCKDGFGIYERVFFPFGKVPKGSKIILYGAGLVGRIFFNQICKTKYCKIVDWVDKNKSGELVDGYVISGKESIYEQNYDFVVVGILKKEILDEAIGELQSFIGDRSKIIITA